MKITNKLCNVPEKIVIHQSKHHITYLITSYNITPKLNINDIIKNIDNFAITLKPK